MPVIMANGLQTHYYDDNLSAPWRAAEPVWIQHGFGRNANFWWQWVAPLAGTYRVLRRDLRGHGGSAAPDPKHVWQVEDLLQDMVAFLDGLKIERVHYVGESVASILGIAFATTYPKRFASMTLVGALTQVYPRVQKIFSQDYPDFPTAVRKLTPGGWAKGLALRGGTSSKGWSPTKSAQNQDPAETQWMLQEWSRTPTEALAGLAELATRANVESLLEKVSTPTLILAAPNSNITTLQEQVVMRERIPTCKILVIDGPDHEIYFNRTDDCIAAVRPFLAAHPIARST